MTDSFAARHAGAVVDGSRHYEATPLGSLALHPVTPGAARAMFPVDYLAGDELFVDEHDTGAHGALALQPDPDPLAVDEEPPICRVCNCTDARSCYPPCSWVRDPLALGPLCSRCLSIAIAVTDRDLFDPPAPLLGFVLCGISGAIVGGLLVELAHRVGLL